MYKRSSTNLLKSLGGVLLFKKSLPKSQCSYITNHARRFSKYDKLCKDLHVKNLSNINTYKYGVQGTKRLTKLIQKLYRYQPREFQINNTFSNYLRSKFMYLLNRVVFPTILRGNYILNKPLRKVLSIFMTSNSRTLVRSMSIQLPQKLLKTNIKDVKNNNFGHNDRVINIPKAISLKRNNLKRKYKLFTVVTRTHNQDLRNRTDKTSKLKTVIVNVVINVKTSKRNVKTACDMTNLNRIISNNVPVLVDHICLLESLSKTERFNVKQLSKCSQSTEFHTSAMHGIDSSDCEPSHKSNNWEMKTQYNENRDLPTKISIETCKTYRQNHQNLLVTKIHNEIKNLIMKRSIDSPPSQVPCSMYNCESDGKEITENVMTADNCNDIFEMHSSSDDFSANANSKEMRQKMRSLLEKAINETKSKIQDEKLQNLTNEIRKCVREETNLSFDTSNNDKSSDIFEKIGLDAEEKVSNTDDVNVGQSRTYIEFKKLNIRPDKSPVDEKWLKRTYSKFSKQNHDSVKVEESLKNDAHKNESDKNKKYEANAKARLEQQLKISQKHMNASKSRKNKETKSIHNDEYISNVIGSKFKTFKHRLSKVGNLNVKQKSLKEYILYLKNNRGKSYKENVTAEKDLVEPESLYTSNISERSRKIRSKILTHVKDLKALKKKELNKYISHKTKPKHNQIISGKGHEGKNTSQKPSKNKSDSSTSKGTKGNSGNQSLKNVKKYALKSTELAEEKKIKIKLPPSNLINNHSKESIIKMINEKLINLPYVSRSEDRKTLENGFPTNCISVHVKHNLEMIKKLTGEENLLVEKGITSTKSDEIPSEGTSSSNKETLHSEQEQVIDEKQIGEIANIKKKLSGFDKKTVVICNTPNLFQHNCLTEEVTPYNKKKFMRSAKIKQSQPLIKEKHTSPLEEDVPCIEKQKQLEAENKLIDEDMPCIEKYMLMKRKIINKCRPRFVEESVEETTPCIEKELLMKPREKNQPEIEEKSIYEEMPCIEKEPIKGRNMCQQQPQIEEESIEKDIPCIEKDLMKRRRMNQRKIEEKSVDENMPCIEKQLLMKHRKLNRQQLQIEESNQTSQIPKLHENLLPSKENEQPVEKEIKQAEIKQQLHLENTESKIHNNDIQYETPKSQTLSKEDNSDSHHEISKQRGNRLSLENDESFVENDISKLKQTSSKQDRNDARYIISETHKSILTLEYLPSMGKGFKKIEITLPEHNKNAQYEISKPDQSTSELDIPCVEKELLKQRKLNHERLCGKKEFIENDVSNCVSNESKASFESTPIKKDIPCIEQEIITLKELKTQKLNSKCKGNISPQSTLQDQLSEIDEPCFEKKLLKRILSKVQPKREILTSENERCTENDQTENKAHVAKAPDKLVTPKLNKTVSENSNFNYAKLLFNIENKEHINEKQKKVMQCLSANLKEDILKMRNENAQKLLMKRKIMELENNVSFGSTQQKTVEKGINKSDIEQEKLMQKEITSEVQSEERRINKDKSASEKVKDVNKKSKQAFKKGIQFMKERFIRSIVERMDDNKSQKYKKTQPKINDGILFPTIQSIQRTCLANSKNFKQESKEIGPVDGMYGGKGYITEINHAAQEADRIRLSKIKPGLDSLLKKHDQVISSKTTPYKEQKSSPAFSDLKKQSVPPARPVRTRERRIMEIQCKKPRAISYTERELKKIRTRNVSNNSEQVTTTLRNIVQITTKNGELLEKSKIQIKGKIMKKPKVQTKVKTNGSGNQIQVLNSPSDEIQEDTSQRYSNNLDNQKQMNLNDILKDINNVNVNCDQTLKNELDNTSDLDNLISKKSQEFCTILLQLIKLFSMSAVRDMQKVKDKRYKNWSKGDNSKI